MIERRRTSRIWLAVIIIIQTAVYVLAGMGKAYIYMDEAYSLGLAQYDKVDITANEDFYNYWHTREYYQDYLAVQEKDRGNWRPIYENQKNDVHPPLYYLLLRLVMEVAAQPMNLMEAEVGGAEVRLEAPGGEFSRWPGIILNIVIAAMNTGVMFMIVRRLVGEREHAEVKALTLTAVAGLTVAAVSAVVYIRMYMLLTLFVTLTVWLHLRLLESRERNWRLLAGTSLVALGGVLTQYYYLFFLVPMWVVMAVKYGREKRWKELGAYTGVLAAAGVMSLVIWPWSIQHMFFGYRGQGVLASLMNVPGLLGNIWRYIEVLDYNVFHRILVLWTIITIVSVVFYQLSSDLVSLSSSKESDPAQPENNPQITDKIARTQLRQWNMVLWPTVGYFLTVAAVSPFIELRYIMPITGMAVVLVIAGVYVVVSRMWSEKWRDVMVGAMMGVMMLVAPVQLMMGGMRIELLYRDKEDLMRELEENHAVPTVYFITTENNRFLDNILPFATMDESYLALDLEPTEEEVKEIVEGKDLAAGLYVWISSQYVQTEVLKTVKEATGLGKVRYLRGVNTCEIYYLEK